MSFPFLFLRAYPERHLVLHLPVLQEQPNYGENVILLVRVEAGSVKVAGEDRRVKSTVRCRVVVTAGGRQHGLADPGFVVVVVVVVAIRVITHELTLGSRSRCLFFRGVCKCELANLRLA